MTNAVSRNIIVYVDDDKDDVDLIRESFEKYTQNVELVTFLDGYEALNYLTSIAHSSTRPCLIILDLNLPGLDGKQILRTLRTVDAYKETPVVLFTTSSQPHDKVFAREYNAGFITKPLNYTQMDRITEQLVEHCSDEIKKTIRRLSL